MAIIEAVSKLIVDLLQTLHQALRFADRLMMDAGIPSSIVWFFAIAFAVRFSIITGLRLGLGRWARRPITRQHS
jgi:hypothetical protein